MAKNAKGRAQTAKNRKARKGAGDGKVKLASGADQESSSGNGAPLITESRMENQKQRPFILSARASNCSG